MKIISTLFQLIFCSSIFAQCYNVLSFEGDDDYVTFNSLAAPMSLAPDFTVEFWMKADLNNNTSSPRVGLFSINPGVGNNTFLITMGGSGSTQDGRIVLVDDPTGFDLTSPQVVGDNVCHHVAYVRTGSIGTLFIDGGLAGSHVADYVLTSSDRYSIGQEWDNTIPSDFYNGNLDELRIWTTARTQSQIQSTMNTELTGTLPPGLLAYYDFNQGIPSGSNNTEIILFDRTLNGHNGLLNSFFLNGNSSNWVQDPCVVDPCNNVLSFEGDDDYVTFNSLAAPMSLAPDFTVEFWMKADLNNNTSSPRVGLFSINPGVGNNTFLITMGGSGSTQDGRIVLVDDPTGFDLTSPQVVGDNVCHHVAYVRTGSIGTLFIDGGLAGSHVANYVLTSTDRYSIGQEWDNTIPSDFYNGNMDELRIWTTARTQSQIQSTMNTGLTGTLPPGLLAYYDFNQGIPSGSNNTEIILFDRTLNGHNGLLNSFFLNGNSSNWMQDPCAVNNACCSDSTAFFTAAANVQTFGTLGDCMIHFQAVGLKCNMQINYSWGDNTVDGPFGNNVPVWHTYAGPGTYTVCFTIIEVDANGNICWEYEYCEDVLVLCDICPLNLVQNGMFEQGTPPGGDESIQFATNWSGIWAGGSTADFYNTTNPLPPLVLTPPLPLLQGNFAGFWVHHHPNDPIWREGIMNNLGSPIADNSGCYTLSMKIACLIDGFGTQSISIFGVPIGATGTFSPGPVIPSNANLFTPAAVSLGSYSIPSGCDENFQTIPFTFNSNILPLGGIDRIFITRTDGGGNGGVYVAIDDVCLEPVPCPDTCLCGDFTDMNWRPSQGAPNQTITCGDELVLPCTPPGYMVNFSGNFDCIGNNCPSSVVKWELRELVNNGLVGFGTTSGPGFQVSIPGSSFTYPKVYKLTFIGECDGVECEMCMFTIFTTECPCMCGMFDNIKLVNKKTGLNQNLNCNNQPPVGLTCPPVGKPYKITGKLNCVPASCTGTQLHWELKNHTTGIPVASGNQPGPWFSITLDNNVLAGVNGLYDLVLTGLCGNDTCECILHFDIVGCPSPAMCPCDEDEFRDNVAAGFSYAYDFSIGLCQAIFTPNQLTECDVVTWTIQGQNIVFSATDSTVGNQPFIVTLPTNTLGNYNVWMHVVRPPGTPCDLTFCQFVTLNCLLTPLCQFNEIENPGFDQNSEPGPLGMGGSTEGWVRRAGAPELLGGDACLDPFAIKIVGKCWPNLIDIIDNPIPVSSQKGFKVSACYKASEEDLRPGTQLVLRLSDEPQDSMICIGECIEVARLPIHAASGDEWSTVSSTFYLDDVSGDKFLTLHIENDLAYDDPDANSTIFLDNICFEQNDSAQVVSKTGEALDENAIRLFPNPTSGAFTLEFRGAVPKSGNVQILDLYGRMVGKEHLPSGQLTHQLSVATLPSGMYFVQVTEGGVPIWAERIVKQ